jgi:hypothetical protein
MLGMIVMNFQSHEKSPKLLSIYILIKSACMCIIVMNFLSHEETHIEQLYQI